MDSASEPSVPWPEELDGKPPLIQLTFGIPEDVLQLPCTDTEESSQRLLRSVALRSSLRPPSLSRNLGLAESELESVLYAARAGGVLEEDRYEVSAGASS